jgi:hypothetical protein
MEITVLVERVGTNGYVARDPFGRTADGATADEAVASLRAALTANPGQLVQLVVPPPHPLDGWIGIFKDNPMFDDWTAAIEENRRRQDAEDAARLAAEVESGRG